MLTAALTYSKEDLNQILLLQERNLKSNIDKEEMDQQGFVTLQHDLATLDQMHQLAPTVIIKDGDKVVAYALTMLRQCRQLIPDLEPMFSLFDSISWNNKPLNDHRFYVMGQICVDKAYRGMGLVNELYLHHKKIYQRQFDLLVTEISLQNQRSLRAHEKAGFKTIKNYRHELDEWSVVGWDWS